MLAILAPLLSLAGLEADELKGHFKRQAIVWGLMAAFGVIGIAFLCVAINSALSSAVGPVIAPLIIAVAAILFAIVTLLTAQLIEHAEARRLAEKKRSTEITSLITTAAIAAVPLILRSPLMKDIGIPAGAALASALWFGKSDERRK
jgi:apolipoprotein N-acyltransferase